MENTTLVPQELPTQHSDKKFMVEMSELGNAPSFEESLQKMREGALKKSTLNVAVQYFDFQLNKPETFMFLGITQMTTQDGEVMPAAVLMDAEKNTFTNQATLLVEALVKAQVAAYQWVEITWTGTRKTGKGNQVRIWKVYPYND